MFFARDGAPMFNPKGVPYTFCFRRILEECTTVDEAEKLLRAAERTTILSLALCDRRHMRGAGDDAQERGGAPRQRRHPRLHQSFPQRRVGGWPMLQLCNRYPKLIQARKLDQLDVADVAKKLDEVNMGRMTVQTMIFEPAALKLHLAIGSCPSSALPMKLLELKPLFAP